MVRKSLILSKNIRICSSYFAKGSGLMFRFPGNDFAYIFDFPSVRRVAITMWFVFISIDLISLDSSGVIIELRKGLKPFGSYFLKHSLKTFIELPSGSIASNNIKLGMSVSWSKNELVIF